MNVTNLFKFNSNKYRDLNQNLLMDRHVQWQNIYLNHVLERITVIAVFKGSVIEGDTNCAIKTDISNL